MIMPLLLLVTNHCMHLLILSYIIQSQTVFTCGEDGFVRAWKADHDADHPDQGDLPTPRAAAILANNNKGKIRQRFKPY